MRTILSAIQVIVFSSMGMLLSCVDSSIYERFELPNEFRDYIHGDSTNTKFIRADSMKALNDIFNLVPEYERLLQGKLSVQEQKYTSTQLLYWSLLKGDTGRPDSLYPLVNSWIETETNKGFRGDYFFNRALYNLSPENFRNCLTDLFQAVTLYDSAYGQIHYKVIKSYEQIGRIYRRYTLKSDSALIFLEKAVALTEQNSTLDYSGVMSYFFLADVNSIDRDYLSGLGHIDFAIEKSILRNRSDSLFLGHMHVVKGRLLRKLGKFEEAKQTYGYGIDLISSINDDTVLPLLYRELAFTAILENDQSSYAKAVSNLEALITSGVVSINRVRGYHAFVNNDYKMATHHYEETVRDLLKRREPDLTALMESFYILAESYQKLGEFDLALDNIYKSLVFNTPLRGTAFSWVNLTAL